MKDFIITLIYDKIAMQYSSPLIYNNLECAKRHFKQIIEANPSIANSGDYELYVLGYYNSYTGVLTDSLVDTYAFNKLSPIPLAAFEGGVADGKE